MGVLLEEYRNTRDGLRYGFAVGKVRVLETRLLDRATLERIVDAPSFGEQKRILSESPYGRFLESAKTAEDVEAAIDEALDSAFTFLDEAGLPPGVVRFFRVRFDFANLKAALKARALGVGLEGLLVTHGTRPMEEFEGPLDRLEEPLGAVAREASVIAQAEEDSSVDLLVLDALVDRALFAQLEQQARDARTPFLSLVVSRMIDLANLKTFVRATRAGVSQARVSDGLLLDGGSVSRRDLSRLYLLPEAEGLVALERRFGLRGAPLTSAEDTGDIDVIVDDALAATVRRGRRPEPGPEDVIAYVLAREAEAQVLRVALLGRMAGLDSATLHRRMRASFR